MIELTTELELAYVAARVALNQEQMHGRPPIGEDEKRRAGLAAVLALVERNYDVRIRGPVIGRDHALKCGHDQVVFWSGASWVHPMDMGPCDRPPA